MALHKDIIEHEIYKLAAPLVGMLLISCVAWLFTMMLALENKALKNEQAIIHQQQESNDVWDDIEKLQGDVTNIRIYVGNGFNKNH